MDVATLGKTQLHCLPNLAPDWDLPIEPHIFGHLTRLNIDGGGKFSVLVTQLTNKYWKHNELSLLKRIVRNVKKHILKCYLLYA